MASTGLTPSQAIRNTSSNTNSNPPPTGGGGDAKAKTNPGNRNNGRQRRRNNNKNKNNEASANVTENNNNAEAKPPNNTADGNPNSGQPKKNRRRKNNNKSSNPEEEGKPQAAVSAVDGNSGSKNDDNTKNSNNKKKNKKPNRNRKRYPWRKYVPAGTVDPITLDALVSLPYPPFALRASPPYLPVPDWPPISESEDQPNKKKNPQEIAKDLELEAQERERRLLQEQWGSLKAAAAVVEEDEKAAAGAQTEGEVNQTPGRHLNLFDGRALAYYMVSQLQFIDPLTRRDLDREELIHLDRYLVRHGFTDLNCTEAYDTKGVSLSTAGAASTTAAGRAEILQQEARLLLNRLFSPQSALPPPASQQNTAMNNPLMQQYSNYQASQQRQRQARPSGNNNNPNNNTGFSNYGDETGIYGDEDGGIMVIDDDMNPSLRGGGGGGSRGLRPYQSSTPTLWSANRITNQNQTHPPSLQAENFPSLSSTATLPPSRSPLDTAAPAFVPGGAPPSSASAAATTTSGGVAQQSKKKNLPPASSLKFISSAVKKTTEKEAQRQFAAREEARRKALLSNLTFGNNPANWDATSTAPSSLANPGPTEAQLERNRAFADALGVAGPRTVSWKRPTDTAAVGVTVYPDALILKARENMGPLLKLERKWKAFLEDDKAASCPLGFMPRDLRAFVHEYSDYWKLHTESFDAEPRRYIHCVKLLDTHAPYPLISDAARHWRGPTGMAASSDHVLHQTAGQDTWGREGGRRGPIVADLTGAPKDAPLVSNARAAGLTSERPKLELKERTLPLELPPFVQPTPAPEFEEETEEQLRRRQLRIEEQRRKEKEREERKQRVLELAFASDSEEESLKAMDEVEGDSDWEEGEALYNSDDETGN